MSLETYRLVVDETETTDEMTVDLYDEDDLLEASTRVPYEEFGLLAIRDEDRPDPIEHETTADVMTVSLDIQRQQGAFEIRVLGDTDERLLTERVTDSDWNLAAAE
ncbi:hypothetical protein [Halomarina oriensis]|uniref:Uncharacterized protein n=1 Tax=Halomarina oriensis TaxID=671145 RepID=A0A6B0GLK8_9EURY|nr:hypothetical protein [Halomarina oriensis]MWG35732.1 hypothetical protein [Halomarina oriensis]